MPTKKDAATPATATTPAKGMDASTGGVTVTPNKGADAPTGGVTITPRNATAGADTMNAEDQAKVAELEAHLVAGEFDKVIEGAKILLANTQGEAAKNAAMRLTADAFRKKSDWRQTLAAYQKLRERYKDGSDDWVRTDAIVEIFKASPTGVYQPAGAPVPKAAAGDPPRTLADDAALEEALARLAGFRAKGLKSRVTTVRRGRSPQEVAVAFKPLAETARQLFVISKDAPADSAHEVAAAAGGRLKELGDPMIAQLQTKRERLAPKIEAPWNLTNQDKADMNATVAVCKEMGAAEASYQASLMLMGNWPDGADLRTQSSVRQAAYEQMAVKLKPPDYRGFGYGYGY